jgi:hypothetical protein
MTDEIKIIIKPLDEGYAIFIVEPDSKEPMTDKMASCYTLARGMIKFGLDTPDMAFDYGLLSFREDAKREKTNGNGSYKDVEKTDNVLDITKLLKRKDEK